MKSKEVLIKNQNGLHLRVAAAIVETCKKYNNTSVILSCEDCPHAEACSIMQLMLLNGMPGKTVNIKSDGPHAEIVIEEIAGYLAEDCEL